MLHLSLLTLPRTSMRWRFLQPYELHQVLWKGFPDLPRHTSEDRFLYRHDERDETHSILVQSVTAPNWSFLDNESEGTIALVKRSDPASIEISTRLHFMLRANPVVRRRGYDGTDNRGHDRRRHIAVGSDRARIAERLGVKKDDLPTREEQLIDWLQRKGNEGGFELQDVITGPNRDHIISTRRGGNPMTFTTVDFEGILTVTNPSTFTHTLRHGIGRGKGFGFGLLSVKRSG
jgi:CRISPR system Cascade subunit CasE